MKEITEYIHKVRDICNESKVSLSDFLGDILYYMCLRQMVKREEYQEEDASDIVKIMEALYQPSSIDDIESLRSVYKVVENAYGLDEGILSVIHTTWNKNEILYNTILLELLVATSKIKLDDIGYVLYMERLIDYAAIRIGHRSKNYLSSEGDAEIYSALVDIEDGDLVLDGTVGSGYTLLKCVEGNNCSEIIGIDNDESAIQLATLAMIICGVEVSLQQNDFLSVKPSYNADTIVMDIPFGLKHKEEYKGEALRRAKKWLGSETADEMECLFIGSAIEQMNDDGQLIVKAPNRLLYRNTQALSYFRKKIIKEGLLRAIITLGQVYSRFVDATLLVLEKNSTEVLFVDLVKLQKMTGNGEIGFTDKNKKRLKEVFDSNEVINGISFTVPNDEVLNVGDWSMAKYQNKEHDGVYRTVEVIDGELEECYEELDALIKDGKEML